MSELGSPATQTVRENDFEFTAREDSITGTRPLIRRGTRSEMFSRRCPVTLGAATDHSKQQEEA